MIIRNLTQKTVLAERGSVADSFLSRLVGLIGRTSLDEGEALVITRCNSIHMFFMRFAIDVVFVSKDQTVVGLAKHIRPFRLSKIFLRSDYCIELPAGQIERTATVLGDRIDCPCFRS